MKRRIRQYESDDISISYDVFRCIHAEACVHGLPAVFDKERRPWIQPENADADANAAVVVRCPTGALHYDRADGRGAETPDDTATVRLTLNGPLYVRGDITIIHADGGATVLRDTRAALCRCGASDNKPLCDNAHLASNFRAPGTVTTEKVQLDNITPVSALTVQPTQNGPLILAGRFEILDEAGAVVFRGEEAWLCRCGGSANKPFCDDTHKRNGFTAE
jgi:CDGSH-type Zn-finger protein/uncharacterized Fe-S cluster protein YjdI